jgi:hypothetical protein
MAVPHATTMAELSDFIVGSGIVLNDWAYVHVARIDVFNEPNTESEICA